MIDHVWDGRKIGGLRRKYKVAGCAKGLIPSQVMPERGSSYHPDYDSAGIALTREEEQDWLDSVNSRVGEGVIPYRAHPSGMSFEQYVDAIWGNEEGN